MEFDKISKSLEKVSVTLSGSESLVDYAVIYQRWFPEKDFNLESFKNLPRDIITLFAKDVIGKIFVEYFNRPYDSKRELSVTAEAYKTILKAITQSYRIDMLDIEAALRERGLSETEIEDAKRFFI